MKKFSLAFLILVLATSVLLVGCSPDNTFNGDPINFRIGVEDKVGSSSDNHNALRLIRSVEELSKLRNDFIYIFQFDDSPEWILYDLDELTEEYNENYFQTKAVIVYLFTENSGGNFRRVTSLTREKNELTLNVGRYGLGATCDMAYWTFILEVDLGDVKDVTSIKQNFVDCPHIECGSSQHPWGMLDYVCACNCTCFA